MKKNKQNMKSGGYRRLSADKDVNFNSQLSPPLFSPPTLIMSLTTQELEILSTKAIDAKATAYCMFSIFAEMH
jgi:hypothetical protein